MAPGSGGSKEGPPHPFGGRPARQWRLGLTYRMNLARSAVGICGLLALGCSHKRDTGADPCPSESPALAADAGSHALRTVFLIVFENQNWRSFQGSASAPYINGTLLPSYAHAENYRNGGLHPSLPNYIALEAGSNLGVTSNGSPADLPLPTPCHLTSYLESTGVTWRAYQEGIDGASCPVVNEGRYAVRHDPIVYFEDVSGTPPGRSSARCIEHVRPYAELAGDLQTGRVARYNFITPDLCNSGHDRCAPLNDPVKQTDAWLARELPLLMASQAFQSGGVIFITWDEPESGDEPIGLIAVSPLARAGLASQVPYSHASTLRTVQEILGVTPLLRAAANAAPLTDLFSRYP